MVFEVMLKTGHRTILFFWILANSEYNFLAIHMCNSRVHPRMFVRHTFGFSSLFENTRNYAI